jgi:hypothetical protein
MPPSGNSVIYCGAATWSSVNALEAVGLPAAVLTRTGKVVAANSLLVGLSPEISIGGGDRLYFKKFVDTGFVYGVSKVRDEWHRPRRTFVSLACKRS